METRDAERLAKLSREVAELAAAVLLAPLKLLLRRLLPGATPIDQERWAANGDGPSVGDVETSTPAADDAVPSPHRDDLTGADAARLREVRREEEASPDGPGPELHVEPPWPDYEAMTVVEVLQRLAGADPTTRAMVRLYEETHKNRRGVLRATE